VLFLMLSSSHLLSAVCSRKIFSGCSVPVQFLLTSTLFILLNLLLYYIFLYQHHYLPSLGL